LYQISDPQPLKIRFPIAHDDFFQRRKGKHQIPINDVYLLTLPVLWLEFDALLVRAE
jgi:hypothetical protein